MQKGGKGGTGQRIRISPARLTGKISDWKGTYGWIQPDKPINHPQAKFHRGLIYLAQVDVEAEISGIGSGVSFFCYADGTGLGATNCKPVAGVVPPVQRTVAKPSAARGAFAGAASLSAPAAFLGALAKAAASSKPAAAAGPGQKARVSSALITGQVKSFKSGPGGYGWITPLEPVKHPLFKGQIYVKATDVVGGKVLEPGMTVCFYVYADSQGLGAETCRVLDGSGAQPGTGVFVPPKPTMAASLVAKVAATPAPTIAERERLTVVPTTGDVLEWRGGFGWVKPHAPVDHPEAKKRQGKVYVSKSDLKGITSLQVGQLVQFHVFVDSSGIGGDECMPF